MGEKQQTTQNLRDINQKGKLNPFSAVPLGGKIDLKKMMDKAIKKD